MTSAARGHRHPRARWLLVAVTVIVLVAAPAVGTGWPPAFGALGLAALLVLPSLWAAPAFIAVLVAQIPLAAGLGVPAEGVWGALMVGKSLAVYVLVRLTAAARQLEETRALLATDATRSCRNVCASTTRCVAPSEPTWRRSPSRAPGCRPPWTRQRSPISSRTWSGARARRSPEPAGCSAGTGGSRCAPSSTRPRRCCGQPASPPGSVPQSTSPEGTEEICGRRRPGCCRRAARLLHDHRRGRRRHGPPRRQDGRVRRDDDPERRDEDAVMSSTTARPGAEPAGTARHARLLAAVVTVIFLCRRRCT